MSDRALNTRPADSTVFQRIAKARPASSTGRARAAAAQQGPTPTNAEGRVSTAQLLARFEQTSDDELLARIIAIEEDEKIARKIQEDLARGIEPQLRPFSGRPGGGGPSQQNSRSDSHLNKVGFTDPIDDAGIGSPLASTDAPMRESISRSGGLHNLNEGEAKPLAGRRASALRGSLAISANQSTNLASDESLNADDDHHDDDDASHPHPPATTNSSQPNTSQRADIPQPNYTSTPPQPDRLEFPTPKWDTTASESDATSEKGSEQEQGSGVDPAPAQPPAAVPRHRSARPESARRGVPRHQKLLHSESDDEDNLDNYIGQTIPSDPSATFSALAINDRGDYAERPDHPAMPPRFDSLLDGSQGLGRDDDGDEDDDERDGSRLMFTESTSPPKRLPAAKTRESTTLDAELQELFTYIDAYQPQDVDIVQELKCFMPEYVPCIGDIDPMIKVDPPPSTFQPPSLGITTLDEPTPDQSDPAVLDLHLRAHHKSLLPNTSTPLTPTKIRAIAVSPSDAPQATKQLNQWIGAITTLHAHTPPVSVAYTHPQPDLDALMQAWPAEMEGAFAAAEGVPDPAVEMDVRMYARLVCGLVDVPVYLGGAGETGKMRGKGKRAHVEALHVLFELYREFRDSQHFGHREAAAPTMSAVGLPPAEGGKGGAQ